MTPKEKAVELVEQHRATIRKSDVYDYLSYRVVYLAKQCALIAVDEILNAHLFDLDEKEFWQQVRTEIANL
jgi:hypothetical protein